MSVTGSPLALAPKQMESIALATGRYSVWTGAVRSGKTVASLLRFMMDIAQAPHSGNIVIVGNTKETIFHNVIETLQKSDLFGDLSSDVICRRGSSEATILGRRVRLIGAHDQSAENRIRGMTIYLAYVDEATLLPENFFMQLLARMSEPGAKLLATTNPDSPAHWFRKDYLLRAGELGIRHFHFTIDDNPFLEPVYVAGLKTQYTGLFYKRFILGEWVSAAGAIYDMWDDTKHVVTQLPMITNWLGVGADYGTTNPTAAILAGIGTDGCIYFVGEYRHGSKENARARTDAEHSQEIRKWLNEFEVPGTSIRGVDPQHFIVDPSAASFKRQLYLDGFNVESANNKVIDGIRTVSSLLAADKLKVYKDCVGFIGEIPGYAWDDKKSLMGVDAPVKADDHSLDAGRYILATTRKLWTPFVQTTY